MELQPSALGASPELRQPLHISFLGFSETMIKWSYTRLVRDK